MNLDHDFFHVSKKIEDLKKVFTKNGIFFSPNSSGDPRSDAHQSQIIGGNADKDHTQIIGEIYPPHLPRVSGPLVRGHNHTVEAGKGDCPFFSAGSAQKQCY